jgi:peptidoglycan/xylan/chitin deacetylase (PgdA/CDA1 family)
MYLTQKQKKIGKIISVANHIGFSSIYSILRNHFGSSIVILTYHRIGPYSVPWLQSPIITADFEKQIRYLTKTHLFLSLSKLAEYLREDKNPDKNLAVITFDDGYKDNYNYAYPILKKYNIPATIFLVTGHIDSDKLFWFDKIKYLIWKTKLKKIKLDEIGNFSLKSRFDKLNTLYLISEKFKNIPDNKKNYIIEELANIIKIEIPKSLGKKLILSWEEVKEMSKGGIEFGAHTVTHPILTQISYDQAKFEIIQSKKTIEKKLGLSVNTFCYPNGTNKDFNIELIDLLKNSGFTCAVTTIPAISPSKINLYKLGRLPTAWSFEVFKFFVSGCYSDASAILNSFRRSNV